MVVLFSDSKDNLFFPSFIFKKKWEIQSLVFWNLRVYLFWDMTSEEIVYFLFRMLIAEG